MREQKNSHLGMIGWAMFLTGALSLGSCSGDETIDAIQGEAITFGNAFVANSTRATYSTENLPNTFKVWGSVTGNTGNSVDLYNGATVNRNGAALNQAWDCDQTEYWIPDATYNFMAIVDGDVKDASNNVLNSTTVTNGMPVSIFYSASSQADLLLAELENKGIKTVTTTDACIPSETPVAFTFNHLLSKAMFTFTNVDTKANLTVKDIYMSGTNTKGTYTLPTANAGGSWSSNTAYTTTAPLGFEGASVPVGTTPVSSLERLIIPGTYDIYITFTVEDNQGGQPQNIEATIKGQEFKLGHSYNFTAEIKSGLTYVIFNIIDDNTDWGNGGNQNIEG